MKIRYNTTAKGVIE
jgi:hypothetical protein